MDAILSKLKDIEATPELTKIFEDASVLPHENVKEQLSYKQMIVLADTFYQWAAAPDVDVKHTIQLLGQAKSIRQLAEIVGHEWAPPEPEPERLSLLGFLARQCEGQ